MAIAGAGLGVPPMTWAINQLINHYDWRVTMRILAGITLFMCAASLSYGQVADAKDLRVHLRKRRDSRDVDTGIRHKLKLYLLELLSLNPWKNKAFAVWAVSLSFIAFGNFIPFVFLVSRDFLSRFTAQFHIFHNPIKGWETLSLRRTSLAKS